MVRFDLNETKSLPAALMARRSRWLVGGLTIFVTAAAAATIAYAVTHRLSTPLDSSWIAGVLFVDVIFLLIYLGATPQANFIDVNQEGVHLMYPGGRVRTVHWLDSGLKVDMGQTPGAPDGLSKGRPLHVLYGYRPFQTFLTKGAFEGVLAAARERGLLIEEMRGPRPGWTRTIITAKKVR